MAKILTNTVECIASLPEQPMVVVGGVVYRIYLGVYPYNSFAAKVGSFVRAIS